MYFQNVSPKINFFYIFCYFHWPLITTRPATIHCSQAAQACNHHGVEQTVAVLHWPHHQWVASPAGMCRPAARRTHSTLSEWHVYFIYTCREHLSCCSFLGAFCVYKTHFRTADKIDGLQCPVSVQIWGVLITKIYIIWSPNASRHLAGFWWPVMLIAALISCNNYRNTTARKLSPRQTIHCYNINQLSVV